MPEEFRAYFFCSQYHWSHQEYLDTSASFCDICLFTENMKSARADREAKRGGDDGVWFGN